MSVGEIAQLITSLAAVGALFMSLRNSGKIKQVHLTMNSRLDQLLALTRKDALAEGRLEGQGQGRGAQNDG